jgi:multiple antibiotic resistance protein
LTERCAGADFRNKEKETGQGGEPDTRHLEEGVFYPYTFPITSGPGTLVALLTVTAHISNEVLSLDILAHVAVFLAIVVLSVLCYFCYAYAPKITKKIPPPPRPMGSCV